MFFVLRLLGAASFCTRGQAVAFGVEPAEVSFLWACEQSLRLPPRLDVFPQEHSVSCLNSEACNRSKYSRRVVKRRLTIGYATETRQTNRLVARPPACSVSLVFSRHDLAACLSSRILKKCVSSKFFAGLERPCLKCSAPY